MKKLALALLLCVSLVHAETFKDIVKKHGKELEVLVKEAKNCKKIADILDANSSNKEAVNKLLTCAKPLNKAWESWEKEAWMAAQSLTDKQKQALLNNPNSKETKFITNLAEYGVNYAVVITVAQKWTDKHK
ncbi:hypothetical protein [Suttonella ornithocola]|uniref:Uncharacterized protein n=1 Tax=Suttonella ornithocola TaxID=279832 RepID=A0A380MRT5_9GAMM|nr:hypothetical protein [Suttonella ornithocola]SUO95275.1 Uncharacterised protein [Suttonella ornithocola]